MEAYTAFAKVYDRLMDNVPYEKWSDFIEFAISEFGISSPNRDAVDPLESEKNLVLDLGCGTGTLAKLMYQKGFDLIGVDISQEMLDVAMSQKGDDEILYICQDMCELDLYCTIGTVYCTCDSVNYLLEDEEVEQCFGRVANFLFPEGIFVFDFNTVYKYKEFYGDSTIAEAIEDCSFIWENYFDEDSNVNQYDLTLFIKEEDSELYRREEETHFQRGYTVEEMRAFLENTGFNILAFVDESVLDSDDYEDKIRTMCANSNGTAMIGITETSSRVIAIARVIK